MCLTRWSANVAREETRVLCVILTLNAVKGKNLSTYAQTLIGDSSVVLPEWEGLLRMTFYHFHP